tara:strand:- start:1459 stop:3849 length:2391 start_codon:yes stop_codon:yes gene_type:complete
MAEIKHVAVIGSGVMGAAIAAHMANAGVDVTLVDIVPEGESNKNALAEAAIAKLLKTNPAPLSHKRNAKRIKAGNMDDLSCIKDADWIIEAVLERIDIKHDVYSKLDAARKKDSFVSSNTSTIPLKVLIEGQSPAFKKDFLITHFFNPPRYMRLLELVGGADTSKDALDTIREFGDIHLGKVVVDCNDTPGFIANRIGCYWLTSGLLTAIEQGVSVEEADAVMGRPAGIPKTGVFGLMDLIGIDLLPLIASAFEQTLPETDAFRTRYKQPDQVAKMIADGYTGRKGKGGFYRLNTEGEEKVKEAVCLKTGNYAPADKPRLKSVKAARDGLQALVTYDDIGGKYAWAVLRDTLHYAASLVPEIADDIRSVDAAMRMGYNWKYGPFELIDRLGDNNVSGPKWFADALRKEGLDVPDIIQKAGDRPFYEEQNDTAHFLNVNGEYEPVPFNADSFMLSEVKTKLITKNASASLWDIGDGIACLEFTSKMNSQDPTSLDMIAKATEIVAKDFKGLVIANDGDNFCVGANIGVLLFAANLAAWKTIEGIIKQGQDAMMGLKYAPFPVVGAPTGMALGGGCEILLHCDAVQAHIETYTGLVEVGVGLIPGWGGCKEMIYRQLEARRKSDAIAAKMGGFFSFISPVKTLNTMPAVSKAFEYIATATVSKSAEYAKSMLILNDKSRITMNRTRLLADAKATCLELSEDYQAPETYSITLPGSTARTGLKMAINSFVKSGKATPHDAVISQHVAEVLSGGDTDITEEITEQQLLDLERAVFMKMVRHPDSLDRIEHMLKTNKPLRN